MRASIATLLLLAATATATAAAIPTTPQTDNCGYYFHETSGKSIDIPGNMACLHNKGSSSDLDFFNIAAHCEKCIWWRYVTKYPLRWVGEAGWGKWADVVNVVVIIAMARLCMSRIGRVQDGIRMGLSGGRIAGRVFSVRCEEIGG
jgi:hypothetical protein